MSPKIIIRIWRCSECRWTLETHHLGKLFDDHAARDELGHIRKPLRRCTGVWERWTATRDEDE